MKKLISLFLLAGLVLALVPVLAEEGSNPTVYSTSTGTSTDRMKKEKNKEKREISKDKKAITFDPVCIQTAVEKRDNAIIAATDTFSAAAKTALTTRRDALKAAWALTDRTARRTALKAAGKAYRETLSKARKDLNAAKRAAWKQWGTDLKACKGTPNDDPGAGQGVDASL